MKFLEIFDFKFKNKLNLRTNTMRRIFELLDDKKNALIIETGTTRQKNNWQWDGQSTVVWDSYVCHNGGQVWSVDLDKNAVELAKGLVSSKTKVICSDSFSFLHNFKDKEKIDLLYLDTLDAHLPESSLHHLFEFCHVWAALKPGCIIVVDDVLEPNKGKHALIELFLSTIGYSPILKEYQIIWVK